MTFEESCPITAKVTWAVRFVGVGYILGVLHEEKIKPKTRVGYFLRVEYFSGHCGHGAPTPDTTFPLGRGAVGHAVFDGPLDGAWGAGATDRWLLQEQASEARPALGRTRGRSPDGAD